MDKLSVSYYLSESLVSKIDERGKIATNRSAQLSEDLTQFYDMLDFGIRCAMRAFTAEELRLIINAIHSRTRKTWPSLSTSRSSLLDCVSRMNENTSCIETKIEHLDNLTCFALFDWARANL